MEPAAFFLGGNIDRPSPDRVRLSSRAYVDRLAAKWLAKPPDEFPAVHTPATKELSAAYEDALLREDTPSTELLSRYASKCGAVIYAVPSTRGDVAWAVGMCARTLTFPTARMEKCLDRVILYLAQHRDLALVFDGTHDSPLHAYSDSDWAVGHSTTGWAVMFGNAAVGYGSKRQQSIALSSTEAEIMAASRTALEVMFFRGVL